MGEHESHLNDLDDPEKKSVIIAHLRGLRGQLETLKGWKDAEPQYQKFYARTFGSPDFKTQFEAIYTKLSALLSDESKINQNSYDDIYKEYEELSKHVGN